MNLKKELMNFLQSLDGDELRNLADGSLPEEMAVDAYLGIKAEAKQRAAHHQMLEGATVKESPQPSATVEEWLRNNYPEFIIHCKNTDRSIPFFVRMLEEYAAKPVAEREVPECRQCAFESVGGGRFRCSICGYEYSR